MTIDGSKWRGRFSDGLYAAYPKIVKSGGFMEDKRKKIQEKLKELEQVESVLRDIELAGEYGGDVTSSTDILLNAIDKIQEELLSMELEIGLAKLEQGQLENREAVRVLGKYILKLVEDILDKSIDLA